MILALYILLLIAVSLPARKKSANTRNGLRVAVSFLFILAIQIAVKIIADPAEIGFAFSSSLFSAVQNITFENEANWAANTAIGFRAQVWIIIFIASVLTVESVVCALFGKWVSRTAFRLRGLFQKDHYVFFGQADDAQLLIADVRANVRRPCITYIPSQPLASDSELYRVCRIERSDYLKRLKRKKEYHVALLPNDDLDLLNLDVLHQLNADYPNGGNIHVTAFLDNDIIRYQDIHADNIDACVLSAEQLLVYRCFDSCSPVDLLKQDRAFSEDSLPYLQKPFGICVIGFGDIGREFLLYSFENAAFLTENGQAGFSGLIIDMALDVKKEIFLTETPYFAEHPLITFVSTAVGTQEYFDTLEAHIRELHRIIISTGDTQLNVKTAVNLCRFMDRIGLWRGRPQIVVILNEPFSGAEALFGRYDNIRTLDVNELSISYETVIERQIDSAARAVNEQYSKSNHSDAPWNRLGTFTQASNRAAVRDGYNKKALYAMCRADRETTMDFLAQYEHSRWNAFYHAHGWRVMPVDDLTPEEKACFVTKHPKEKRHICLVPWEELDDLPQKEPGLLKYYDMENVIRALEETDPEQDVTNRKNLS